MRRLPYLIIAACSCFALGACGYKGPLYLPTAVAKPATAPAATTPSSARSAPGTAPARTASR